MKYRIGGTHCRIVLCHNDISFVPIDKTNSSIEASKGDVKSKESSSGQEGSKDDKDAGNSSRLVLFIESISAFNLL